MDRLLYVVASGAKETLRAQVVNTNNLANVSTTGFQGDSASFKSMLMRGPGMESRVYAQAQGYGVDNSRGGFATTGRELDVAVKGDGWMAVQAPDGGEAFTRAGDLRINSAGLLTTGAGHPVMGDAGPIALPPFQKLEIGSDGTVSLQPLGQDVATLAVVDRIKLVKPDPAMMAKDQDGLLRMTDGSEADADASIGIMAGTLESSNVSAVEAMVNMIQLARQYEMQLKSIKTAEELDAASARVMQMS